MNPSSSISTRLRGHIISFNCVPWNELEPIDCNVSDKMISFRTGHFEKMKLGKIFKFVLEKSIFSRRGQKSELLSNVCKPLKTSSGMLDVLNAFSQQTTNDSGKMTFFRCNVSEKTFGRISVRLE